ncbi:uncharacterized protein LOC113513039 [Galleria mellonella]|uniref:Uncharacterized protein LOC113513039 n=1 Tax=Galleria mellonella TaxID=7137 RepID=A0ABM3MCD6_GALME|nr:uncharacterized protein LOC113513039 [Galleria mellonella]
MSDKITFSVNGHKYSVSSEVDSDVSLNDYVRERLNLRGTKYMCKEGGCGCCIVAVRAPTDNGVSRIFSVNSCLVSITSCQDWEVTTIEGIGDRGRGYHPIQRTLAEYDGTQCGYCSPGWVMSMYSLLESSHHDLTQYEIENSLGSNTCRCTGYRPILDAFKSFAKDAPKPKLKDIEDLKLCKNKEECEHACDKSWCFVKANDKDNVIKKIHLKDDRIWYRIAQVQDIFNILDSEGYDSYMLVNGNTGRGAVPIFAFPRVLIDVSAIQEIKGHYIDQNLVVGAGTTLTDLMDIFKTVSHDQEEFAYLYKLYEHLDLVAHIPVRNIGTIAGNLMVKHKNLNFSSDIFLLLETIGATLTIVEKTSVHTVTVEDFLSVDMTGKVITLVKIPPLSPNHQFVSFKIMPRAQNAHAQVNAAFLYKFDSYDQETVLSARIVIGGLSGHFIHARETEKFLINKKIFNNNVLQQALHILNEELIVEEIAGELKPQYRKKAALGVFYKGLLNIIPEKQLKPWYRSGARDFRKTRPISKAATVFDTNPIIWPITEPMPKLDALIQSAGEAKYVNDMPTDPKEVFCAFVTSDICTGEIESIDPTPALNLPGVLAFFSAKDIPGNNSFLSQKVPAQPMSEEIFAEKEVKYYDQAIGVIVAETEKLANRAALLVRTKYKVDKRKPILTITDAQKRDPNRITLYAVIPARDRGIDIQKIIKGSQNIFWQYHYPMETLSCVSIPSEDGIDLYPCTQWTDSVHISVAEMLNIEQNRINLTVPRCGGAYGLKISRTSHVACVSALVTYLMNRPSRFVLSIQASLRIIGKRLPCKSEYELAVNNVGVIQYFEYHIYVDNGYVYSDSVVTYIPPSLKSCYDNRRWQSKIFNVTTDTASNTYARAPGFLESISMTEYMMERISYEINMDPVKVRLNNLSPERTDVTEIVQTLLKDGEYDKRKEEVKKFNEINRWKKRGLRIAMMSYPIIIAMDYHVLMSVYHGDGTVVVKHGGIEIGQGINTKVIQVVAYTLNISIDKVKVKPADVATIPNNFTTGGSRTSQAVCFGAIKCCQLLLDRLSTIRETLNNPTWELLIETAFNRGINLQTSYHVNANDQEPYRVGGAALAEVELDILTGEHEILRVDIVEDVGTSVNPELEIGQIEGAFEMGAGYWTHEHIIYDDKTGELLTDRTWYYHVPHAKDIPIDFRVQVRRNSYNPLGTLGAKGVSEPPMCLSISVAFALREAIAASRKDSGYPNEWFNVDGPFTLEKNVLKSDVRLDEFLFT